VSLLREDATMSMPPYSFWIQGGTAIRGWLLGRGSGCRGSKLVKTMASGVPAFGQYRANPDGGFMAWGIIVLELRDARVAAINTFLDVENLFPLFGLPLHLNN
jgi:RNA polymerase sigma-70 factor, ECF subfamily